MGHQNWFIKGIRAAFEPSKDPKYRTGGEKMRGEKKTAGKNRGQNRTGRIRRGKERRTTDQGQRTTEDDE